MTARFICDECGREAALRTDHGCELCLFEADLPDIVAGTMDPETAQERGVAVASAYLFPLLDAAEAAGLPRGEVAEIVVRTIRAARADGDEGVYGRIVEALASAVEHGA